MWDTFKTRWQQGHRTQAFPPAQPLPERFRGRPTIDAGRCAAGCTACRDACPTEAITLAPLTFDLGRCTFCPACAEACPSGAIAWTPDYRLATRTREGLLLRDAALPLATALDRKMRALFGRSLKLRQVSAGGCNGCELELQALNNVVFDLSRFGIQFVASPRHADGLVITGPVTANMRLALQKTYEAVPDPKLVIAVGACAISGGPFLNSPACHNGATSTVPVDLFIPGCPPHPLTILDGLLRLLGRLESGRERNTA
ncbi:MAG: NADH-quinone oxidoreductase subunit NuoB [Deltaproteobacteria bacterium]|nr:NADH-quinone oxidoreductase subunit NuoB [Deltaproteobacteria bacterium]